MDDPKPKMKSSGNIFSNNQENSKYPGFGSQNFGLELSTITKPEV